MRRGSVTLGLALGLALVLVAKGARAEAPTKMQCIDANAAAQERIRTRKLVAARRLLETCIDPACPEMVRGDCAQRLDDLDKATPTIVFSAKDGDGRDLTAVSVTIDGAPFADALRGIALPVDPGEHTFVFSAAGAPNVQRALVIAEAERNRRELIVLGAPTAKPAPVSGAPTTTPAPGSTAGGGAAPGSPGGGMRMAAYVTGGAALVAVGVASYFGVGAGDLWSTSKSACNVTSCPDHARAVDARDHAMTDATLSTALFVGGGALAATSVVLFVLSPRSETSAARSSLRVTPMFGTDRAGVTLGRAF